MLGDVVKKGRHLESRAVRKWKARCNVESARKNFVDLLLSPTPNGDAAQMALEYEQRIAERDLENAEYELLCEADGDNKDELARGRAKDLAASFVLWAILNTPTNCVRGNNSKWMDEFVDFENIKDR